MRSYHRWHHQLSGGKTSWTTNRATVGPAIIHDWWCEHARLVVRPVCGRLRFEIAGKKFWTSTLLRLILLWRWPTTSATCRTLFVWFAHDCNMLRSQLGRNLVASPVWLALKPCWIVYIIVSLAVCLRCSMDCHFYCWIIGRLRLSSTYACSSSNPSANQCCQIKIKCQAQWPSKTSPTPQIIKHDTLIVLSCQRHTPIDKEGNAFQVHHAHNIYLMVSGWFYHSFQFSATYCVTVNYIV